jgi:hypothetical protein
MKEGAKRIRQPSQGKLGFKGDFFSENQQLSLYV